MSDRGELHPDEDTLEAYAMGKLGETESQRVEEHLLLCADCGDRLAELDAFLATLREVAQEPEDQGDPAPDASVDRGVDENFEEFPG